MKNSWKMLMIEGDSVSEIEFEDGTRMGSPTQIRQIHQGHRDGGDRCRRNPASRHAAAAGDAAAGAAAEPVDTDPPPVTAPLDQ